MTQAIQREFLFHVYIGTAYQGPQRARNPKQAVELFANRMNKSPYIFNAKQANPDELVRDLKRPHAR